MLLILGGAACFVTFWVDKFLLLRFYSCAMRARAVVLGFTLPPELCAGGIVCLVV